MDVRLSGKRSIYEDIVEEYARFIRLGVLREGEKLPSCRALAMQLGINPNTVERAFGELERRGLVRTIPKKGAFVHRICDAAAHARAEAVRQLKEMRAAGLTAREVYALAREVFGPPPSGADAPAGGMNAPPTADAAPDINAAPPTADGADKFDDERGERK